MELFRVEPEPESKAVTVAQISSKKWSTSIHKLRASFKVVVFKDGSHLSISCHIPSMSFSCCGVGLHS
jgi:hypothetical protein